MSWTGSTRKRPILAGILDETERSGIHVQPCADSPRQAALPSLVPIGIASNTRHLQPNQNLTQDLRQRQGRLSRLYRPAIRELPKHQSCNPIQHAGQPQLHQHSVQTVQMLMDVFEHQDRALQSRKIGRPEQGHHQRKTPSNQRSLHTTASNRNPRLAFWIPKAPAHFLAAHQRPEMPFRERIRCTTEFHARHRTRHRHQSRPSEKSHLERCQIAVSNNPFWITPHGLEVDPFQ
jgi:hypothetical protein